MSTRVGNVILLDSSEGISEEGKKIREFLLKCGVPEEEVDAKVSIKEMCELIVEQGILAYPDGKKPTVEQVYEYSPTGELYMIGEWYREALLQKYVVGDRNDV